MDEPTHEHYRGYGVMALEFESGHLLALRVMPENDYAPYAAVWHRTPEGAWSMYIDAPHHELFCPRMYGPILTHSGSASVDVSWSGERHLTVTVVEPALEWTLRLRSSPVTRVVNRVLPKLSREVYRSRPALTLIRTLADHALGFGTMDLEGTLPGGQRILVQPRHLLMVGDSRAVLEGVDLGRPVRSAENPVTGTFRWPAVGVFAYGDIWIEIDDPAEYRRRLATFTEPRTAARSLDRSRRPRRNAPVSGPR